MNKRIQIIVSFLLLAVCANGQVVVDNSISSRYFYSKDQTTILYDDAGALIRILKRSLVEVPADLETFEPLGQSLGRDSKHVFYKNEILSELDAATCVFDKKNKLLRDKDHLFRFSASKYELLTPIPDADPSTYECVESGFPANWWRDKDHYFYGHRKTIADRATFRWDSIDYVYRDKNHVYSPKIAWKDILVVMEGLDPDSYTTLRFGTEPCAIGWARDKNGYYYKQKKISADPQTLKFDIYTMPFDKDSIYIPLPDGNIKTVAYKNQIQVLGNNTMVDDDRAYIAWGCGDVDIKKYKNKDKIRIVANGKYRRLYLIDDILYLSLKGNDDIRNQLSGVDFDTYRLSQPDSVCSYFATDKSRVYYSINIIPNADLETFVVLGNSYAKDKNAVYYKTKILKDADPETFVTFDEDYGKDKKYVYEKETLLEGYKPHKFVKKRGLYPHQKKGGSGSSQRIKAPKKSWYQILPGRRS